MVAVQGEMLVSEFLEIAKSFSPGLALALIVIIWGSAQIKTMSRKLGQVEQARVDDLKEVVGNNTRALTEMTTVISRCQRK